MNGEFKDKFQEVGALWPTKSGKGLSGKLKVAIAADQRIFVFHNNDYQENMTYPKFKIFIEKTGDPEPQQTIPQEDVPF